MINGGMFVTKVDGQLKRQMWYANNLAFSEELEKPPRDLFMDPWMKQGNLQSMLNAMDQKTKFSNVA